MLGLAVALGAFAPASAQAAITFDGSPGTNAPPATLGTYTMTAFGADPQALFANVSGVAGPTGSVGFSPVLNHRRVGNGWATWSHGYRGDVYYTNGATSARLTLPAGTGAFYLYAEPNPFSTFNVSATAQDGTSSGPVPVSGAAGAKYFGFYATGGDTLASITVSSSVDFALGEFGIAEAAPANSAPTVSAISGAGSVFEGDTKTYSVTASDPDSDPLTYAWSITSGLGQISGPADGSSVDVTFPDGPDSVGLQVQVSDGQGHSETRSATIAVANVAPTIGTLAVTGNGATACVGGNAIGLDFTFTDPAGANDTHAGTAAWGDGASDAFTTSPVSLSHTYAAGAYTIRVNVSDSDGDAATERTAAVSLLYDRAGFQAPINNDGSSVFKIGSTVPVKLTVTDCDGTPVGTLNPDVDLTKVDASPAQTVNEVVSSSSADSGDDMRFADGKYIYNLSTKNSQFCQASNPACSGPDLTAGTYELTVSDATFAPLVVRFDLRSK